MKKVNGFPETTEKRRKELEELAALNDSEIDTTDVREWTDEDFVRSVLSSSIYKARKEQIPAEIDADVLLWLRQGKEHNQLRAY
jgi:uncharacterized protein (DUF4415 family)